MSVAKYKAPLVSPLFGGMMITRIAEARNEKTDNPQDRAVLCSKPGPGPGDAVGNTIYLYVKGAGYGWFVDLTPTDDNEFTTPSRARAEGKPVKPKPCSGRWHPAERDPFPRWLGVSPLPEL